MTRPARSGYWGGRAENGSVPGGLTFEMLYSGPLCGAHKQGRAVIAAEHAGERAAVELHSIEYLDTLADAHAITIADIGIPDRPFSVEADAVWRVVPDLCPDAPIRQ
jgi:hypothetical protein